MKCFIINDYDDIKKINDKSERGEMPAKVEQDVFRLMIGGYIEADESYDDYNGYSHQTVYSTRQYDLKSENCVVLKGVLVGYYRSGSVFILKSLNTEFRYPETWAKEILFYSPKKAKSAVFGEVDNEEKANVAILEVPEGVEEVKTGGYKNLAKLYLPSSLKRIIFNFSYCKNLKEVYFAGSASDWARVEFDGEKSNPSYVGAEVYIEGKVLTYADISAEKINAYAFANFKRLEEVRLSKTAVLSPYAFERCSSLKRIVLSDGIKEIPDGCFWGGAALEEVVLPDGVERIGVHAFAGAGFKKIVFPADLQVIDKKAFDNCVNLEEAELPARLKTVKEYAFYGNNNLRSVRSVGNDLERVETYAFAYCDSLEEVVFNDGLKEVGRECFASDKNLKTLVLPDSVEDLGALAVTDCFSLHYFKIPEKIKKFTSGSSAYAELFVPKGIERLDVDVYGDLVVRYEGTTKEFNALEYYLRFKEKTSVKVICADGEVTPKRTRLL